MFSFRKTMPVMNGAALLINRGNFFTGLLEDANLTPEGKWKSGKWYVKRIARWLDMELNVPLSPLRKEKEIPEHGSTENEDKGFKMSFLSRVLLKRIDIEAESEKRRKNYGTWLLIHKSFNIEPVFKNLPPGVVPMAFPAYVRNRAKWLAWGERNGVELKTWPTLPKWVSRNSPSSVQRWSRLLLFPVLKPPKESWVRDFCPR